MALKVIMLRHSIEKKKAELEQLRARDAEFITREAELEAAINEAETEAQEQAVSEMVEQFDTEKQAHEASKTALAGEIEGLEADLSEIEKDSPEPGTSPAQQEERNGEIYMDTRKKFFGMEMQQRDAFLARPDVKDFLSRLRSFKGTKRAVTGADLTIPTVVLDLIRQNIMEYSKLYKHVRVRTVSGKARQTVMGLIPEGVWTEMCATLDELDLSFSGVEVDGYKVGGYIAICNATLEDSDVNLASEIITALGQAIGLALDKAILYGKGASSKMPMGIVTRLVQDADPSDPKTTIPWKDLHTSNVVALTGKTDAALFKGIIEASGAANSEYSRGSKFWAVNEKTRTKLLANSVSINAAGAIVAGVNGEMPVIGGALEVLNFIPDDVIVGGYGDLYLLAERAGAAIEQSEHVKFIEDQTVFKGTARYDGLPVIAEGFVAIGINGNTPDAASVTFAGA